MAEGLREGEGKDGGEMKEENWRGETGERERGQERKEEWRERARK